MSSGDPFDKKSFDNGNGNGNGITQLDKNNYKEKTIVYYGEGKTTEILLKTFSNAKQIWNVYANAKGLYYKIKQRKNLIIDLLHN